MPSLAINLCGLSFLPRAPSEYFAKLTKRIVNRRRHSIITKLTNSVSATREDLLHSLMEATYKKRKLTEKQIADNGVLFFIAGSDTSSVTLSNCSWYLAQYPDFQAKLTAAIDKAITCDQDITYDNLNRIELLEAVINETLRLSPTVSRTTRVASRDCKLDDVHVSKGTTVWISNYVIMRSSENFENPDEFLPERWLDGHYGLRHNNQAFIAFAPGPRNCIGQRFAMFEMKLFLVRMLREFEFVKCDQTETKLSFYAGQQVMGAKSVTLTVVARNNNQ